MKKIMLVALLAAAGCSSKKGGGSECDAAIAKAIENFSTNVKEHARDPQIVEGMTSFLDKLKGVLTERCKADSWPPEVVSCFPTAKNPRDMQACQSKLNPDQTAKLKGDLAKIMAASAGMDMNRRMPPGMAGHPQTLTGNTGSGAAAAPGTPPGSPDTPGTAAPGTAAPGTAAPPAAPPAPSGTAAPASSAAPPASGSAPK